MITQELAVKALQLAIKHLGQGSMVSSARLCLSDAVHNLSRGEYEYAYERACKSISYSVGMFSPDYQSVKAFPS